MAVTTGPNDCPTDRAAVPGGLGAVLPMIAITITGTAVPAPASATA